MNLLFEINIDAFLLFIFEEIILFFAFDESLTIL